jgi:outer membrane protein
MQTYRLPVAALRQPILATLLAVLVFGLSLPAHAVSADDGDLNFIRLGGQRAIFHDQNSGFNGPGIPPGSHLETQTEDISTIYLSFARGLTSHVEVEAVLGQVPEFKVHARGPATVGSVPYAGQPVSSGKQASPALVVNYKFNEPGDFYRPYMGAGLVYSHFYDLKVTPQADAINGGATSIHYSDAFGLVLVAGVSFRVMDHWRAQFSITKADVRPDVTTTTAGSQRVNHYDLRPIVFTGAFSYGF